MWHYRYPHLAVHKSVIGSFPCVIRLHYHALLRHYYCSRRSENVLPSRVKITVSSFCVGSEMQFRLISASRSHPKSRLKITGVFEVTSAATPFTRDSVCGWDVLYSCCGTWVFNSCCVTWVFNSCFVTWVFNSCWGTWVFNSCYVTCECLIPVMIWVFTSCCVCNSCCVTGVFNFCWVFISCCVTWVFNFCCWCYV